MELGFQIAVLAIEAVSLTVLLIELVLKIRYKKE